jgi:hypothetical protein
LLASLVLPDFAVQKGWAVPLWTSIAVPLVILPLLVVLIRKVMQTELGVSARDAVTHSF